jgi:hypothetical protein
MKCGGKATFFLGLRAFSPSTLWTTLGFFRLLFRTDTISNKLTQRGEREPLHVAAIPPG